MATHRSGQEKEAPSVFVAAGACGTISCQDAAEGGLAVKNVDLIGVSLDELGGEAPAVGAEICVEGRRYRVVNVKPPKVRSSRWRRRVAQDDKEKWELLVERVEEPGHLEGPVEDRHGGE
jgi:hypothetical protein